MQARPTAKRYTASDFAVDVLTAVAFVSATLLVMALLGSI